MPYNLSCGLVALIMMESNALMDNEGVREVQQVGLDC